MRQPHFFLITKLLVLRLSLLFLIVVPFKSGEAKLVNQGVFKQFSVESGLNNSVVYAVFQDHDGFMWFATKDGLNKFDGINFTSYSLTDQPYQYARDNMVLSLIQGENSPLYCSTESGRIYFFNKEKDKFERVQIKGINPIISVVYDMLLLDPDHLVVCSASGLFCIDLINNSIDYINNINLITQEVFKDSEGVLWIGTNQGIFSGTYSIDNLSDKQPIERLAILRDEVIMSFNEDSEGRIWIGTRDKGLFVFDKKENKLYDLNSEIIANQTRIVPIKDITMHANKAYIALDGEGICVFNPQLKIVSKLMHIDDIPQSLSNKGVYDIFFDRDQTMWIATYGGGVNVYSSSTNRFYKINHEPYNENSLKNNTARAFLETKNGNLWFGTKKGISIYNRKKDKWEHILQSQNKNEDIIVLTLCQSKDGSVWAGTYNKGLFKINPLNLTYEKVAKTNNAGKAVGSDYIYSIIEDKKGQIWAGGIIGNLIVYNTQTKKSREIPLTNVKAIKQSSWGTIYVGTTEGLYIIDEETYEVDRPRPYSILLNQNRIFSIFEGTDSNKKQLWLGTEGGGMIFWDIDKKAMQVYSTEDGLPSNFIYGIETDQNNHLWISTTKGLSHFNPLNNEFKNYDKSDGLSDQEFNFGPHGKTSNGEIFFGGQNGFTFFNPDSLSIDYSIPRLAFNSFKLFGKEQLIDSENAVLSNHINTTNQIELKHNQNSITFGFSAINFVNPNKIKYSWKLEGFDQNWSVPTNKREAIYTNLIPDTYTFKVKASNQDEIWGDNIRQVQINIDPPITQTVWAYLIYVVIFSSILYFVINFFRIRIKEKNALAKTRFFVNIAHDLRTPLTLIKAPLENLSHSSFMDKTDLKSLMIATKNVNRLNRLVTQLMEFQKADLGKSQFYPAPHQFIHFIKELSLSFMPLIENQKLKLNFDFPTEDFVLWFDRDKMEKILYNLISNAIKYSKENGEINISVKSFKKRCQVQISDTGIGIPINQQKNIFTRYFRARNVINSQETGSGVGLVLVKKLVELHEGKISFKSIEDKGTTFTIEIPFKKYETSGLAIQSKDNEIDIQPLFKTTTECKSGSNEIKKLKYKILLVEDNRELLTYLSDVLGKYFNILQAEDGQKALEIVHDKHPDLIVSDVMMPVMNGNEMCMLLKSDIASSHIPIILLTSLNNVDSKIESFNIGADSYIEKPFDISYLIARINNLLLTRIRLKEKFAFHSNIDESETVYKSLDQELLKKAKEYILQNITNQDLSVETLARELAMSRPVLYRKLKALTDQSPQDFIRLIRLMEAKKLLLSNNLNISDVAYETGFADPKYFSTSFKKFFNTTPTQFVKDHLKEIDKF